MGWIDQRLTGDPLAFLHIQAAWNRATAFPFLATLHWLHHPEPSLTVQGGWAFPALAILFSAIGGLLALWMLKNRAWWPAVWYMGVTILLANSSNSFEGIPRFVAELPPLYLGLALFGVQYRSPYSVLVATVSMMALYSTLWVLGVHAVQN